MSPPTTRLLQGKEEKCSIVNTFSGISDFDLWFVHHTLLLPSHNEFAGGVLISQFLSGSGDLLHMFFYFFICVGLNRARWLGEPLPVINICSGKSKISTKRMGEPIERTNVYHNCYIGKTWKTWRTNELGNHSLALTAVEIEVIPIGHVEC